MSLLQAKASEKAAIFDALEDSVLFVKAILGHETWETQEEMLRSIQNNEQTVVKSCHASSKTFTAAEAAIWWTTYYYSRGESSAVLTTAPTMPQVKDLVWREMHAALAQAAERFAFPLPYKTYWELGPKNFAFGRTTRSDVGGPAGVRFQGLHGDHVLIIVDEAPGIDADIWAAIEGMRAGGHVHIFAVGQPSVPGGPFYDFFTKERKLWTKITIDAFDTPNLKGLVPPDTEGGIIGDIPNLTEEQRKEVKIPYLVTRDWVWRRYMAWGIQSPFWAAKVRGQFPKQDRDSLIYLDWIEKARSREREVDEKNWYYVGIDVAEAGESETVAIILDRNGTIVASDAWSDAEPRGLTVRFLQPFRKNIGGMSVDKVGVGAYFVRHLQDEGFPAIGVNVGEAPSSSDGDEDGTTFANLKAECAWRMRKAFEHGDVAGLKDETLESQLSTVKYKPDRKGRVAVESKAELKSRGVSSPDRFEALMLAFHALGGTTSITNMDHVGAGLLRVNPLRNL